MFDPELVYIAPDKYRATISAELASSIVAEVLGRAYPQARLVLAPMADGGEGTAAILGHHFGCAEVEIQLTNSIGEPITTKYMFDALGGRAFIDSSEVIGLKRLSGALRPLDASTFPLGLAVKDALRRGATSIYLGVGGTSTVDGGAGLLQALGARYFDHSGRPIAAPVSLSGLQSIALADFSAINLTLWRGVLHGLSDVACPLLSRSGMSALSFAPQKGVSEIELPMVSAALANWAAVCGFDPTSNRFGGAGGGLGFALECVLGVDMQLGADFVARCYGMFDKARPSLVISGEGRLDEQSMAGKVVGALARHFLPLGVPMAVLPGTIDKSVKLPNGLIAIPCDEFMPERQLSPEVAVERLRMAVGELSGRLNR